MTAVDAGIKVATEPAPASSATTQTLDIGVSVFGTIETSGDQDWFRVDLVAGQTYEFRLHGFGLTELVNTILRLYGPNGVTLLTSNDDSASWDGANSLDSRIVFTATQTGTHFISAGGAGTNTGNYLLTAVPQNPSGMVFTPDEIAWQLINNYNEQYGSEVAWNVGADRTLTVNITGLTAAGQTLARAALQMWSDVTGILFQEITTTAEITFDDSDAGVNAYATWSYSGTTITGATVMITTGWLAQSGTGYGSYSFETYIHEIGHALGLGHGGNYNGSADYGVDNFYLNDSLYLSIMSYMQAIGDNIGGPNTFVGADFRAMLTPALADIIAVNMLYGHSTATRVGDTTYGYNANTGSAVLNSFVTTPDAFMTVHDDGGIDTLDFSGYAGAQRIDLNAGASSNVMGGIFNLWISRSTTIENVNGGSGNDTISGNGQNNTIVGNSGNDTIVAGLGADTVYGNQNDDTLYGNEGNDTLYGGQHIDVLYGGQDNDILYGNFQNDFLYGNFGNDTLYGGQDNDYLHGGRDDDFLYGNLGDDDLWGGAGNDVIDGGGDFDTAWFAGARSLYTVVNNGGGGWSVVEISTGYTDTLTNIERLGFDDILLS